MNEWFRARWLVIAIIGLVLTVLLLLLAVMEAPVGLRTPIAFLVVFGATGFAVVGPGGSLSPALRWSLVLGLSIAVAFLYAELLLRLGLFTLPAFVWMLLVTQAVGAAVHVALGSHSHSASRIAGKVET